MAQATTTRTATTRAALLEGALHEFSAFGYRRSSMESVARRAGVSRATLYLHWSGKEELFRALVEQLHEEHVAEMEAVLDAGDLAFEDRLLAILEARFLRFVELTAACAATSPAPRRSGPSGSSPACCARRRPAAKPTWTAPG